MGEGVFTGDCANCSRLPVGLAAFRTAGRMTVEEVPELDEDEITPAALVVQVELEADAINDFASV